MAIMFKKTAVILFLLSHHVFVSTSGSDLPKVSSKRTVDGMSLRRDRIPSERMRMANLEAESAQAIAPAKPQKRRRVVKHKNVINNPSPLGIDELQMNSSSATNVSSVLSSSVEALLTNESQVSVGDWDTFNFKGIGDIGAEEDDDDHILEGESVQRSTEIFLTQEMLRVIKEGNLFEVRSLYRGHPDAFNQINVPFSSLGGLSPFMYAIHTGDRAIVDFLVSTGKVDPNAISDVGVDVFSMAIAKFGDVEIVKEILRTSSIKITVLPAFKLLNFLLYSSGPLLESVIEVMMALKEKSCLSALFVLAKDAVVAGNLKLISFLGKRRFPLNLPYKNDMSFIHYAVIRDDIKMIQLLLSFGADIDAVTRNSRLSPLQVALYNRNHNSIRYLIQRGARIGIEEVIQSAIDNGFTDIFVDFVIRSSEDLTSFILPDQYNLITYCVAKDRPSFLGFCLNYFPQKLNTFAMDRAGRTIYDMELPENASDELKMIVKSLKDSVLTQKDLDEIYDCLDD